MQNITFAFRIAFNSCKFSARVNELKTSAEKQTKDVMNKRIVVILTSKVTHSQTEGEVGSLAVTVDRNVICLVVHEKPPKAGHLGLHGNQPDSWLEDFRSFGFVHANMNLQDCVENHSGVSWHP